MAASPDRPDRRWYPYDSKRFWLGFLALMLVYVPWYLLHFWSFAIVNGTIAFFGPILVGLAVGIRQKDFRFIVIALVYPLIILVLAWWMIVQYPSYTLP